MSDDVRGLACSSEILALVPESLAREVGIFPIGWADDLLNVAVSVPLSGNDLDRVEFILGFEIDQKIHTSEEIRKALDDHYGERVEGEVSVFYRWKGSNVLDDGEFVIVTSMYSNGGHCIGWTDVPPTHPDHGLWQWIIAQGDRYDDIISGDALEVRGYPGRVREGDWLRVFEVPVPLPHPSRPGMGTGTSAAPRSQSPFPGSASAFRIASNITAQV